jgi:hypothetical protein
MNNGDYTIEFWDTNTGIPISKVETAVTNEVLNLSAPAFARDIAFKVGPHNQ